MISHLFQYRDEFHQAPLTYVHSAGAVNLEQLEIYKDFKSLGSLGPSVVL